MDEGRECYLISTQKAFTVHAFILPKKGVTFHSVGFQSPVAIGKSPWV